MTVRELLENWLKENKCWGLKCRCPGSVRNGCTKGSIGGCLNNNCIIVYKKNSDGSYCTEKK